VPIEPSSNPEVVLVSGEIDLSNLGDMVVALDRAISHSRYVTVHLENVTFMGLEGARALMRAAESLPDGGRLYAIGPSQAIMRTMDILEASRLRKLVLLPEC
jgi:anti-anti-sigma factor